MMKYTKIRAFSAVLAMVLLLTALFACGGGDTTAETSDTVPTTGSTTPESSGTTPESSSTTPESSSTTPESSSTTPESSTTMPDETPPTPSEAGVDLVLFIGQSNMAGRGVANEATEVPEGHAYEFRAISDPTMLYPLVEPFGVNENNAASGVNENKKTGSLVSAFCETYYQATGRPIVAVSCSKGGEKISFFDVGTEVYDDAVARVKAAQDFLKTEYESGKSEFKLKNTYVVWLQGESDGDAATSASTYTAALTRIVEGFREDIGCEETFIIPIGTYNGADGTRRANYNTIRDAQILFCEDNDDASVVSLVLPDLYRYGYMKDEFHFKQAGYEIVGKDAGANMAYFVKNGEKPDCQHYYEDASESDRAFSEQDGHVQIALSAALENTPYAYTVSGRANNIVESFVWEASTADGIQIMPDLGVQWATNNISPKASYVVDFSMTGEYYVILNASFKDPTSDSVFITVNGGAITPLTASDAVGADRWLTEESWRITIPYAGEHTINLYPREDGAVIHSLYLVHVDHIDEVDWDALAAG